MPRQEHSILFITFHSSVWELPQTPKAVELCGIIQICWSMISLPIYQRRRESSFKDGAYHQEMRTWESGQLRTTWLLVRTNPRDIQVGSQLPSFRNGKLQASLKGKEPASKLFESAGAELLFPLPRGMETKVRWSLLLNGYIHHPIGHP